MIYRSNLLICKSIEIDVTSISDFKQITFFFKNLPVYNIIELSLLSLIVSNKIVYKWSHYIIEKVARKSIPRLRLNERERAIRKLAARMTQV